MRVAFIVSFRVLKDFLSVQMLTRFGWPALHRQFLVTQLICSVLALVMFPIWVLTNGALTSEMIVVFGWLCGPLAAALVLIQTRSLTAAFFVQSITLTGLITTVAAVTGGVQSFAVAWLLVVPFEAALSERRWNVLYAFAAVLAAVTLLFQGEANNWFAAYTPLTAADPSGALLGPVALIIYATALTLRIQSVHRASQDTILEDGERYRLLADNSTDLITRHKSDGDVMFASPAARSLAGVHPESLKGKGLLNLIHVADRPAFLHLMGDVVARGLTMVGEFRMKTSLPRAGADSYPVDGPHGGIMPDHVYSAVEMRCRPVWDQFGRVIGSVSTTRDISERRAQEEALKEAHASLQELSASKSQFLANMSHELRTPLNAIIGFSEILEQELVGPLENEKQREYVNLIRQSGAHLLQVVTDILDMSKIESGTFDIVPETIEPAKLIETCSSIMGQQAEQRGIALRKIVPENLPEAVADPRACRQILINLISNAIKFSDNGDTVTVGVRVEGRTLAYFVRDSGIGMSSADLERVGQPFFQAESTHDRRYEGTGLGVSVVKGLTELHRGRVKFESEVGRGTCVTVYIPLECDPNETVVRVLEPKESCVPDVSDIQQLIDEKDRKTA